VKLIGGSQLDIVGVGPFPQKYVTIIHRRYADAK